MLEIIIKPLMIMSCMVLSGYESMRNKVLDANDHVQQVAGHLKKTLPQLA